MCHFLISSFSLPFLGAFPLPTLSSCSSSTSTYHSIWFLSHLSQISKEKSNGFQISFFFSESRSSTLWTKWVVEHMLIWWFLVYECISPLRSPNHSLMLKLCGGTADVVCWCHHKNVSELLGFSFSFFGFGVLCVKENKLWLKLMIMTEFFLVLLDHLLASPTSCFLYGSWGSQHHGGNSLPWNCTSKHFQTENFRTLKQRLRKKFERFPNAIFSVSAR